MMRESTHISALFLDIGGVMLTNGWDRHARRCAAEQFHLDYDEMDENHHLTFDTYEEGKLSLNDYLDRVVFYKPRSFSRDEFQEFMFAQSQPYPQMLTLLRKLKRRYKLHMTAVSNEGRELTIHRIRRFDLISIIDTFVSSCFVHFRKPDPDMYRMAVDITQVPVEHTVYIDDRPMFVDVAESMGIHGIRHKDFETTRDALAQWGLVPEDTVVHV